MFPISLFVRICQNLTQRRTIQYIVDQSNQIQTNLINWCSCCIRKLSQPISTEFECDYIIKNKISETIKLKYLLMRVLLQLGIIYCFHKQVLVNNINSWAVNPLHKQILWKTAICQEWAAQIKCVNHVQQEFNFKWLKADLQWIASQ